MELYIVCTDEDDASPLGVYTQVSKAVKKVNKYLDDCDYWDQKSEYKWSYGFHHHIWVEKVIVEDFPVHNHTIYLILSTEEGAPIGVFFQKENALAKVQTWPDETYSTNDKDTWDLQYGGQIMIKPYVIRDMPTVTKKAR